MKIAFVGKGGSGKTTIASLVARYLASQKLPVLAIDADINQHLANSVGLEETPPPMGLEIHRIKEYIRGKNEHISSAADMIKTTPPGRGSLLLRLQENNPLWDYFMRQANGVRIMTVGPFTEDDLGVKCYHSKTGSVELILNHLIDKQKEYVLVDMTAGADSFASGLFTRFDITFLVVEPTTKSVSVYDQYKQYARNYNVLIKVIGNKIHDDTDVNFIRNHVRNDLVEIISYSSYIHRLEKGQLLPLTEIEATNKTALEKIVGEIDKQTKNWEKFYKQALEFHIKNTESWANASVGKDLTTQIDPDFSLAEAIKQL